MTSKHLRTLNVRFSRHGSNRQQTQIPKHSPQLRQYICPAYRTFGPYTRPYTQPISMHSSSLLCPKLWSRPHRSSPAWSHTSSLSSESLRLCFFLLTPRPPPPSVFALGTPFPIISISFALSRPASSARLTSVSLVPFWFWHSTEWHPARDSLWCFSPEREGDGTTACPFASGLQSSDSVIVPTSAFSTISPGSTSPDLVNGSMPGLRGQTTAAKCPWLREPARSIGAQWMADQGVSPVNCYRIFIALK